MTSSRPPHAHRFSPSPSQHPYLSSTPPTSTPQPPAAPTLPHSSTPQPQSTPQTLAPFFTLISNPSSTAHKHPVVHYVFSDDEFDPIPPGASGKGQEQEREQERQQERVVVVDMNADGETVAAAHSLSADWQVVGANVASAPQWMAGDEDGGGGGGAGASGSSGGLMMTICGLEAPKIGSMGAAVTASGTTGRGGGGGKETLYELAEMYHERMAEIKSVIEYAGGSTSASASAEPEP
ncbi:unnamed protein product [Tuber melanosporum]|uniref:(Perigord truffle) hypothetical protein n=1 Tax=Tuber melanosporum (strain Mel28) TaxID=656061 RepID=D5GCN6_TUBMM|nr:uncharacterized protein GSTUM_00000777001 [Tuber melanosporum]CAZ82279.1 unnamed protein product [Tuber melanosporum]